MKQPALVAFALSLMVAVMRFNELVSALTHGARAQAIGAIMLVMVSLGSAFVLVSELPRFPRMRQFFEDGEVRWGVTLVVTMMLLALYAPILTQHDPQYALYGRLRPPSPTHWLGTDASGRDVLTRILYGARISLAVSLSATLLAVGVGMATGLGSALSGERVDGFITSLVDAGIAFPRVFLLLALFALSPTVSLPILVIILGLTSWFDIARLVRAEVVSLRRAEFVMATTGLGFRTRTTMFQHVLPNVAGPIIVSATLTIGYLILIESGLSYVGIGLQTGTPSWGTLISEGYTNLRAAPQLTLVPGALIAITMIGFSLIGDGVRRSLDPQRT